MNVKMIAARHLASPSPVRWLFVGDSITQGAAHTAGWRDYTQLFKERLGELGRNEDIVINTAVGGWTLAHFVPRLEERVFAYQPHVVFVMFGTNDAVRGDEGLRAFQNTYEATLRTISSRQIDVIVQTTVPVCPVDPDAYVHARHADPTLRITKAQGLRMRQRFISEYVRATIEAAAAANVPVIDHFGEWSAHARSLEMLTDGGFHPNGLGHRLIARKSFAEMGIFDSASAVCRYAEQTDAPLHRGES